ncbi:hypothetical protein [Hymenobacter sp. B1770]|uniref:hypothetical protein n=1 Tax=Hymenobacter sp. B1770 TaxID=1718788 RepID=UPI003CF24F9B
MNKLRILLAAVSIVLIGLISCSTDGTENKEEQFWEWFKSNESQYFSDSDNSEKLFDELSSELHKVDENLTFEFSPINKSSVKEFTISADGIVDAFPAVMVLVKKAPKLPNWKINAFRQRVPGDSIEIKYDSFKIAYEDVYFRYSPDADKLEIQLNIRGFKDTPDFKNATYVLLDGLIGEYDMETKISAIDFKALEETEKAKLFKIIYLRQVVDELKKDNNTDAFR